MVHERDESRVRLADGPPGPAAALLPAEDAHQDRQGNQESAVFIFGPPRRSSRADPVVVRRLHCLCFKKKKKKSHN